MVRLGGCGYTLARFGQLQGQFVVVACDYEFAIGVSWLPLFPLADRLHPVIFLWSVRFSDVFRARLAFKRGVLRDCKLMQLGTDGRPIVGFPDCLIWRGCSCDV